MSKKKKRLLNIKALRESRDLSQRELADKLGVTSLTVSTWERGAHAPSGLALNALRAVFPGETLFEEVGALLEGSVSLAGTNCLESSRHGDEP